MPSYPTYCRRTTLSRTPVISISRPTGQTAISPTTHISKPSYTTYTVRESYGHFCNIINCRGLLCRINSPATHQDLTTAKRVIYSPFLGPINICRDHDYRRNAFCGLCLHEAPLFESAGLIIPHTAGQLTIENEDEEIWSHVDATCKICRQEWLWRRVCDDPSGREAIGGRTVALELCSSRLWLLLGLRGEVVLYGMAGWRSWQFGCGC